MNCIRLLFCFYNFIFLAIGCGILGVGIWLSVDIRAEGILAELLHSISNGGVGGTPTNHNINTVEMIRQSSFVLIAFGCFIFLLSFLGYCGSLKESRFLLGFYTFLLTLILILEILAVVLIFSVYGPQVEDQTKGILRENLLKRYGDANEDNFTNLIDAFQVSKKCCGIYNGTDYRDSIVLSAKGYLVPASCCKDPSNILDVGCTKLPTKENSYTNIGCWDKIKNELMSETGKTIALAVGITIGVLQLTGIIFACWIYKESKYSFA